MLVLVGEVFYYKKKTRSDLSKPTVFNAQIQPISVIDYAGKLNKNSVLLGPGEFIPVYKKKSRLSPLPVYSENWFCNNNPINLSSDKIDYNN